MRDKIEMSQNDPDVMEIPKGSFLYDFLIEKSDCEGILKKMKSGQNDNYMPVEIAELSNEKSLNSGRGAKEKISPAEFGFESVRRLDYKKDEFSRRDQAILRLAAFASRFSEVCQPEQLQEVIDKWLESVGFAKKDLQLLHKLMDNSYIYRQAPLEEEKIKNWVGQYKNQKELSMQICLARAQTGAFVKDNKQAAIYDRLLKFIQKLPKLGYPYQLPLAAETEAREIEYVRQKTGVNRETGGYSFLSKHNKLEEMELKLRHMTETPDEQLDESIMSGRDTIRTKQFESIVSELEHLFLHSEQIIMANEIENPELRNVMKEPTDQATETKRVFESLSVDEIDKKKQKQEIDKQISQLTEDIERESNTNVSEFLQQQQLAGFDGFLLKFGYVRKKVRELVESERRDRIGYKQIQTEERQKEKTRMEYGLVQLCVEAIGKLSNSLDKFGFKARSSLRQLTEISARKDNSIVLYKEIKCAVQEIVNLAEDYKKLFELWRNQSAVLLSEQSKERMTNFEAAICNILREAHVAQNDIDVSTASQMLCRLKNLYQEEISFQPDEVAARKKMKIEKGIRMEIDDSLSSQQVLSNQILFVPTLEELEKVRMAVEHMREHCEKDAVANISGLDMVKQLMDSRVRFEERTSPESKIMVSHFTPRKNALKIIETGRIRAGAKIDLEASLSPQGKIIGSDSIAFSVWGTEPEYSAEEKELGKLDPKGLGFVFPYSEAVGQGNRFFEYRNSQGGVEEELHVLDEGRGLAIENAFVLVHDDERDYWEKQFKKNGFSHGWIAEHFINFSHYAELDEMLRFDDSPLAQKARKYQTGLRLCHERGDMIWNERVSLSPFFAKPEALRMLATPLFVGEKVQNKVDREDSGDLMVL